MAANNKEGDFGYTKDNQELTFSEKRSKTRLESTLTDKLKKSLQSCKVDENEEKLEGLAVQFRKNAVKTRILDGLLYILRQLMACYDGSKAFGYLPYGDAYDIFCDFMERKVEDKEFRDHLLNEEYGLCVFVVTLIDTRYIVLQNETVDTGKFLSEIEEHVISDQKHIPRFDLNAESLNRVLKSMDTEYDKSCLKAIIFATVTWKKAKELGIKPENAAKHLEKIVNVSIECERANEAAEDILKLRDKETLKVIDEKIKVIENTLDKRESLISERRKEDLVSEKTSLLERKEWIEKDLLQSEPQSKRRLQQRKRRLARSLIDENRVKRRKLGAGAKKCLDTDDEEFIARCIEETSTAHGRRHDIVLYSNHRVKKRHFLSLANYNLYRKGKKLIKSATTVLNRGRPKNIRSKTAKLHCGKSLFCSKKPPKTEDESGLATHHQRAHVRNCKLDMFSEKNKATSLMISFDDKAYIRPGTDVGARTVKKGVIYDVSDESKQKKLPQHDFSEAKSHQTPSSFRFINGKVEDVGDGEKFIHEEDQTIVTVRPKAYIGSSGSVWASDLMKIKWEAPQLFEQCQNTAFHSFPLELRKFCHRVRDTVNYFEDCTIKSDVMCVTSSPDCEFKQYEIKKCDWLNTQLSEAVNSFNEKKSNITLAADIASASEILGLINSIQELLTDMNPNTMANARCVWEHLKKVTDLCRAITAFIDNLQLPPLRNYILQATDAGPGVGVSNVEVKYRDIEISRINNWIHMNRIHRAPHDSGQNEAERSNAAIGEALVDGKALMWEYFKPTDNMSQGEIDELTVNAYKELEAKTMERNSWRVSQDVVSRIDGEPGPAGDCMRAFVTNTKEKQFFFNTKELQEYNAAKSEKRKEQIPGHNYFKKLDDIVETCVTSGEMFHEYRADQSVSPTPRPLPDESKLPKFHYLPVKDTPTLDKEGIERKADDYHPRASLRALHKEKAINVNDPASIETFSKKYIVEESIVKDYLTHLNHIDMMSGKRKQENETKKQKEDEMSCDEFDWYKMLDDGTLEKLRVAILDKYIDHHQLLSVRKKNKPEKLRAIITHLTNQRNSEDGSDDDEVLNEIGESSDSFSDSSSDMSDASSTD